MDRSGTYSNLGPLVRELETLYAARLGVQPSQVVAVANATLGLQGAVALVPPTKWVVPGFTFAATGLAVLGAGREVALADVSLDDWVMHLDPSRCMPTWGLMPVLPFGAPVSFDRWLGHEHVVIDAAASLGADQIALKGLPEHWAVVFSLHATKVLPAGEGGIVVLGNPSAAHRFREWMNFGFDGSRESIVAGTNAKMSEIHAAYALASLDDWSRERREWAEPLEAASEITLALNLETPLNKYRGVRPYWICQFDSSERARMAEAELHRAGIQTRCWWPKALDQMPAFAGASVLGRLDNSVLLSSRSIGLPMFRGLTDRHLNRIEDVLKRLG